MFSLPRGVHPQKEPSLFVLDPTGIVTLASEPQNA
jgi:hypothetical protein